MLVATMISRIKNDTEHRSECDTLSCLFAIARIVIVEPERGTAARHQIDKDDRGGHD